MTFKDFCLAILRVLLAEKYTEKTGIKKMLRKKYWSNIYSLLVHIDLVAPYNQENFKCRTRTIYSIVS